MCRSKQPGPTVTALQLRMPLVMGVCVRALLSPSTVRSGPASARIGSDSRLSNSRRPKLHQSSRVSSRSRTRDKETHVDGSYHNTTPQSPLHHAMKRVSPGLGGLQAGPGRAHLQLFHCRFEIRNSSAFGNRTMSTIIALLWSFAALS